MSQRIHPAALATTSDGEVLINAAELTTERKLAAVLRRASSEPGAIFIGVRLTARETEKQVIARIDTSAAEAASAISVGRQRRRRATTRRRTSTAS